MKCNKIVLIVHEIGDFRVAPIFEHTLCVAFSPQVNFIDRTTAAASEANADICGNGCWVSATDPYVL